MSERMVLVAGVPGFCLKAEPIYMPVVPSFCAGDEAKCHRYYTAGHVSPGKPGQGSDSGRAE